MSFFKFEKGEEKELERYNVHTPVPTYEHDCDRCTFICSTHAFGRIVDIWKSCSSIEGGYIVRYSSDGPDYQTVSDPKIYRAGRDDVRCGYDGNPSGEIMNTMYTMLEAVEKEVERLKPFWEKNKALRERIREFYDNKRKEKEASS